MNSKVLLVVAAVLILVGVLKPDLSSIINNSTRDRVDVVNVIKPTNKGLLDACFDVIKSFKNGPSSRTADAKRLSSLYSDIATLIELDGEDEVIKTTDEVRQANSLAGVMLKLDMKGKYKDLASSCNSVIQAAIGDDSVLLDKDLRAKAADGFKALAWACNEGSK
jgi:hypothetical protein